MKILKCEYACLLAFIICICVSTYKLDKSCDSIRQEILRFHVIAASDSEKDQLIKLQLRDELLERGKEIFSGSKTKEEAEKKLSEKITLLEEYANSFLEEKNYNADAIVRLEKVYFPTRKYDSFTLPAGFYDAVRVVIGKGEGKNWWCIMFPALCLPAATEEKASFDGILTGYEKKIITEEKYEIRLWLVEKWQEIKNMYNN